MSTNKDEKPIEATVTEGFLYSLAAKGEWNKFLVDLREYMTINGIRERIDTLKRLPTIRTNITNASYEDVVLKRQIDERIAELTALWDTQEAKK